MKENIVMEIVLEEEERELLEEACVLLDNISQFYNGLDENYYNLYEMYEEVADARYFVSRVLDHFKPIQIMKGAKLRRR